MALNGGDIADRLIGADRLLAAWGVIRRRDLGKPEDYVVTTKLLETGSWIGSPFQQVVQTGSSLRRRLTDLGPALRSGRLERRRIRLIRNQVAPAQPPDRVPVSYRMVGRGAGPAWVDLI